MVGSYQAAFEAFENIQCTRETIVIIINQIMCAVYFGAMALRQSQSNHTSQRKTHQRSLSLQPSSLFSGLAQLSLNFPRSVNPSTTGGNWPQHRHLLLQLKDDRDCPMTRTILAGSLRIFVGRFCTIFKSLGEILDLTPSTDPEPGRWGPAGRSKL